MSTLPKTTKKIMGMRKKGQPWFCDDAVIECAVISNIKQFQYNITKEYNFNQFAHTQTHLTLM